MILSELSHTLIGSEIVKLGGEIRDRIRQGELIDNFTVGDFDPKIFPIPKELEEAIVDAYRQGFTNYPPGEGALELRQAVSAWLKKEQGLEYNTEEILIASGGRPLIYALFRAICNTGDRILYAVPSWNNNHYTHFVGGQHVLIEVTAAEGFMPTADLLRPHLKGATFLALCSPQNPTGTTFRKEELKAICDLVVEENERRGEGEKKLYVMYDQMYGQLTYGDIQHHDPVSLHPGMRPYTVYIDAISKAFAATGVRVGWAFGPASVLNKMKAILSHVGAWAPMAEQKALTQFLGQEEAIRRYLKGFRSEIEERLVGIYNGLTALKEKGYPVDAITPEAAIYLTIKFDLKGKKTPDGNELQDQSAVTSYLLSAAGLAVVPFHAFGAPKDSPWYRLSVGTCRKEAIPEMFERLERALSALA